MATPAATTAVKPPSPALPSPTATVTPVSPTIALSPRSMVSQTEQGWKVTIKSSDGTSNEVIFEPKASEHPMAEVPLQEKADPEKADPEKAVAVKKPAKPSTTLRVYLIIQYILNSILAITIIAIMVLTLVKYNSTKNVKGAWPTNPVVSPTILMLLVSMLNVLMDAVNLLVQCCSTRVIRSVGAVVAKVRNFTGSLSVILPAIAAGFCAFAKNSTNGNDLWGWSCTDAADAMQSVNSSGTICSSTLAAWTFQLLQIAFQFLSVAVPMYAKWRMKEEKAAGAGAKDELQNTDDETAMLIDESTKVFASFSTAKMGSGGEKM